MILILLLLGLTKSVFTLNCTGSRLDLANLVLNSWSSSVFQVKANSAGTNKDISFPPQNAYDGEISPYNFYQSACSSTDPAEYCENVGNASLPVITDMGYHWVMLKLKQPITILDVEIQSRTLDIHTAQRSANVEVFVSSREPVGDLSNQFNARIMDRWNEGYWRYCGRTIPPANVTKKGQVLSVSCRNVYFPVSYILLRRKQVFYDDPLCCLSFHEIFLKGIPQDNIAITLDITGNEKVGSQLTLSCHFLQDLCEDMQNITVIKACKILDFNAGTSQCVRRKKWTLYNLSVFETGQYYCEIEFIGLPIPPVRSTYKIVKISQPASSTFTISDSQDIYENTTATYTCISKGGFPPPQHTVYFPDQEDKFKEATLNNSLLSVQGDKYFEEFSYYLYNRMSSGQMQMSRKLNGRNAICKISQDGFDPNTEYTHLQVYFESESLLQLRSVALRSGATESDKSFFCTSTEGFPAPKHVITIGGQPISNQDARLSLRHTKKTGLYGGESIETEITILDPSLLSQTIECIVVQDNKFTRKLFADIGEFPQLLSYTERSSHADDIPHALMIGIIVCTVAAITVLLSLIAYYFIRNQPISSIFSYSPVNTVNDDDVAYL